MVEKKSWKEFRDCGMIWYINMFLHIFGWCIVIDIDPATKEIREAYPARTSFRGFDQSSNERGYKRVSQYMKDNADKLLEEAKE